MPADLASLARGKGQSQNVCGVRDHGTKVVAWEARDSGSWAGDVARAAAHLFSDRKEKLRYHTHPMACAQTATPPADQPVGRASL